MIAAARRALGWPRRLASVTTRIVTNRIIACGPQLEYQMPRIAIPKREDAPAESKLILDNVDKMLGFVPRRQHRRDDRADCPAPVEQLHEQCGADPDRFPQFHEGSLARGAILWRGEGSRIQCTDGPRSPVSSASTSRPRAWTARGGSSTASGRAGSRRSMSVEVWLKDIAPSAGLMIGFGQAPCTRTSHMSIGRRTGSARMRAFTGPLE